MAEFCYYCIQDIFPDLAPTKNDLRHTSDDPIKFTCEGCGTRLFFSDGKPVEAHVSDLGIRALSNMHFFEHSGAATLELMRRLERCQPASVVGPGMMIYLDENDGVKSEWLPAGRGWNGKGLQVKTVQPIYYQS